MREEQLCASIFWLIYLDDAIESQLNIDEIFLLS